MDWTAAVLHKVWAALETFHPSAHLAFAKGHEPVAEAIDDRCTNQCWCSPGAHCQDLEGTLLLCSPPGSREHNPNRTSSIAAVALDDRQAVSDYRGLDDGCPPQGLGSA